MEALVFERTGDPINVLSIAQAEAPAADHNSAKVSVRLRPIQPADHMFIRGKYRLKPTFPQIAGLEGSGVLLENVDERLRAGARVAFRWPGTWAGTAVVPKSRLIPVPDDIPEPIACQVSLNPITAWALAELASVNPGDWVIVTAAHSTVSRLITCLLHHRGVQVIGVARRMDPDCPADAVILIDDPEIRNRIADLSPAPAALLDSVGGPTTSVLLECLRNGAVAVSYGVQDPRPVMVTNATIVYSNLIWRGFGIDSWLAALPPPTFDRMMSELWRLLRSGSMDLPVQAKFPLSGYKEALAASQVPGLLGKVLLE